MKTEEKTPTFTRKSGFFREGWRELGRKLERRKFGKQLEQQDQERNAALARLGQRAWQEKIDLSPFAELRDQLNRIDQRAGELTATAKKLEEERAALEARLQAQSAKYAGQRQAVEERKRPVNAAFEAARERLAEQDRAIKRIEARQAAVVAELAALDQQITSLQGTAGPEQAEADFGDEGGWGKEKCGRNRSETRQFRALGFSGDVKLTPSVVRGSTRH